MEEETWRSNRGDVFGVPLGRPWTLFGSLWGALGLHFAVPGHLWDPLWAAWVPLALFQTPLGCHWPSFAILLAVLGYLWDPFGHLGLPSAVF